MGQHWLPLNKEQRREAAMSEVVVPQSQKKGTLDTAMQGLQAYGTISGIQRNNAETEAMKRRMKLLEQQNQTAGEDGTEAATEE